MEVGSGVIFLVHCLASVIFHVVGMILGLLLSGSYAGRYGSVAGLGIVIIIYSLTVEDDPRIDPTIKPGLSILLFIAGYSTFMMSLFLYQRVVESAREMYRNSQI